MRSTYKILEDLLVIEVDLNSLENRVFGYLWTSPTPSKVVMFFWSLLLNRTPTRSNLAIRNVFGLGVKSQL